MIKQWWAGTSERERMLLGIAGGISVLLIFWLILLGPALEARGQAEQRLASEGRRMSQLERAIQIKRIKALTLNEETPQNTSSEPLKAKITQTAASLGLSVSRLQGDDAEGIGVFIEQADPRLLYYWIDDLERNYGAEVTRLTVEQSGGQFVRARIEMEPKR